jgi:hypothetical protein
MERPVDVPPENTTARFDASPFFFHAGSVF